MSYSYIAPVAIWFRDDIACLHPYVLNAKDGWFRKTEGLGKGYGLMLRSVALTSKNGETYSHGMRYKVKMTYRPCADDTGTVLENELCWMYVDSDYGSAEKALQYIRDTMHNWVP